MEDKLLKFYKSLVIISSIIFLLFLFLAAFKDNLNQEWQEYQSQYQKILLEKAKNEKERYSGEKFSSQIYQTVLDDLGRIDRCTTCHLGVENHTMNDVPIPFLVHSGSYFEHHEMENYGCTVCHGGQGRALNRNEAHAASENIFWGYPLIPFHYIQSSCARCHIAIFGFEPHEEELEKLHQGLHIFQSEGCLGCHKARGVGGILGPDLTDQGNKTKKEYNFRHVEGEQSVYNWLKAHFLQPNIVSPGSKMFKFELDQENMESLIVFTLGLYKPTFPLKYYSLDVVREFKLKRNELNGKHAYSILCSACHGKNGEGMPYKEYEFGVPTLNNMDFQSVASREFIEFTIREGRGKRNMASWGPKHSGISDHEIDNIINVVRAWKPAAPAGNEIRNTPGDAAQGRELFQRDCSMCHGDNGQGDLAVSLNIPEFLSIASDDFLYLAIIKGRANTAMPSWSLFSVAEAANIIKYIRTWQTLPSRRISNEEILGNVQKGQELFHYLCIRCHGKFGLGGIGPAILNSDFLAAASNHYLKESMALGRGHTAMLGWTRGLPEKDRLSQQNLDDIVAYMRQIDNTKLEIIYPGESLGSPSNGKKLFSKLCAPCHGDHGEGKQAPALNNHEFLNAASNGYLLATITLGRNETPMPSWGRGSEKYKKLNSKERRDLTAHVRSWQTIIIKRRWTKDMEVTSIE